MTITEDEHNPFMASEDEWDSAGRVNNAFRSHQNKNPGSPTVPNEITLKATKSSNKQDDALKEENPILSYFFRTEIYNQKDNTKKDEDHPKDKAERASVRSSIKSINSTSVTSYDADEEKKYNRNSSRMKLPTSSDLPPHPHPRMTDEVSESDSDFHSLNQIPLQKENFFMSFLGSNKNNQNKKNGDKIPKNERPIHLIPKTASNISIRPLSPTSGLQKGEEVTIVAPKGKIGVFIIVVEKGEPCAVHSVKEDSSIYGKLKVGDRIMKIDGLDVTK